MSLYRACDLTRLRTCLAMLTEASRQWWPCELSTINWPGVLLHEGAHFQTPSTYHCGCHPLLTSFPEFYVNIINILSPGKIPYLPPVTSIHNHFERSDAVYELRLSTLDSIVKILNVTTRSCLRARSTTFAKRSTGRKCWRRARVPLMDTASFRAELQHTFRRTTTVQTRELILGTGNLRSSSRRTERREQGCSWCWQ